MTFQGLGDVTYLPLTNVGPLNFTPTVVSYPVTTPSSTAMAAPAPAAATPSPTTASSTIIPGIPDVYLYIGGGAVLLILLMMMMKKK
jgi:hypothetical protein